jgi:zinc protease
LPIGEKEILENFKYDKIISFIRLVPSDLMSVIVVGDIDVTVMEKRLKSISLNIKPYKGKGEKDFEVPNHSATFVAIESDKEAPYTQIQLIYKDYKTPKR